MSKVNNSYLIVHFLSPILYRTKGTHLETMEESWHCRFSLPPCLPRSPTFFFTALILAICFHLRVSVIFFHAYVCLEADGRIPAKIIRHTLQFRGAVLESRFRSINLTFSEFIFVISGDNYFIGYSWNAIHFRLSEKYSELIKSFILFLLCNMFLQWQLASDWNAVLLPLINKNKSAQTYFYPFLT